MFRLHQELGYELISSLSLPSKPFGADMRCQEPRSIGHATPLVPFADMLPLLQQMP